MSMSKNFRQSLKDIMPASIWKMLVLVKSEYEAFAFASRQYIRFRSYGFRPQRFNSLEHYRAFITKTLHTVEKGLSHQDMRIGFGNLVVLELVSVLKEFEEFTPARTEPAYVRALEVLKHYVQEHDRYNYQLESHISDFIYKRLDMTTDNLGAVELTKSDIVRQNNLNFRCFAKSRHSVREFAETNVDTGLILDAIEIAQNAPSACNRQSWRTIIIEDRAKILEVLKYQNGSRGFADSINKLIAICSDRQSFAFPREQQQVYVDGSLYAMTLMYSLHSLGIATCPLSAALSTMQFKKVRKILNLPASEELIIYIAIGNYKERFKVAQSERYQNTSNVRFLNSVD